MPSALHRAGLRFGKIVCRVKTRGLHYSLSWWVQCSMKPPMWEKSSSRMIGTLRVPIPASWIDINRWTTQKCRIQEAIATRPTRDTRDTHGGLFEERTIVGRDIYNTSGYMEGSLVDTSGPLRRSVLYTKRRLIDRLHYLPNPAVWGCLWYFCSNFPIQPCMWASFPEWAIGALQNTMTLKCLYRLGSWHCRWSWEHYWPFELSRGNPLIVRLCSHRDTS